MGVSKVIINGVTRVDLTQDTVASNNLLSGEIATGADGEAVVGAIASKASADLTVSGATVTAPAGFYSATASKSVATITHPNPTASINSSTGVVTASHTQTTGYVTGGTTTGTLNLTTQAAKTVTPTESEQTAVAAGRYTTGIVKVGAISSTYVGSGITQRDSDDLTTSGATVSVPAGYYAEAASKTVASGTAGTPSASKGTVSNHSVSVTPSVTNITGYITGGTKTGTAVTVTAAELESGTKTITENGTGISVSGYSAVNVNVLTGINCPVFTVTSVGETIESVTLTCNMTFQECYDCIYTDDSDDTEEMSAAVLYWPSSLMDGGSDFYEGLSNDSVSVSAITYTATAGGVPYMEITYSRSTGITVSTPSSLDTLSVTANGTYTAPLGKVYTEVDVNVPSSGEEEYVSFIDYDGTILYEYTPAEFMALSALPANPTHSGLTAQGWNWSLSDAKAYVTNYGALVIGQQYVTSSGATEIDINLTGTNRHPYIGILLNGTVTIDWGDNVSDTMTASDPNMTTLIFKDHTYVSPGAYTIKITPSSFDSDTAVYGFYGGVNSTYGSVLFNNDAFNPTGTSNEYNCYISCILAIRLGKRVVIKKGAFHGSRNLRYITIPNSMHIETGYTADYGFQHIWAECRSLISVTLPNGLTQLGNNVFYYCWALTSVSLPKGIKAISMSCFTWCASLSVISIPDTVTTIYGSAFNGCVSLASLTVPDSVTNMSTATDCFRNCYSLKSIKLPNGLTSLTTGFFQDCSALTSVKLPDSLTYLAANMFNNCHALRSVELPSSIRYIPEYAFNNCYALDPVPFPSNLTGIGEYAFSYCYHLVEANIPDGVTRIPNYAFQYCRGLKSVTIPNTVTNIGNYAFQSCEALVSITIPSSVTTLGQRVFSSCGSLQSATFLSNLTTIPAYTFSACAGLQSVTLPSSVTTIDASAFSSCYALGSITIPSNVSSIAANAFNSCLGLQEIHFLPTTPPTLANTNAFTNVPTTCVFYVPTGSLEAYQTATNWSTYASRMQEE